MRDPTGPSDWQFPFGMSDVVLDPSIQDFVPLHSELTALLRDASASDSRLEGVTALRSLLRTADIASHDPECTVERLSSEWRVTDWDAQQELLRSLRLWGQRVAAIKEVNLASSLWAYDRLVGILTYGGPKDLILPSFTFRHTYPLGRLITLAPAKTVGNSLARIVANSTDAEVLKYAVYLLGIVNHPSSEPWRITRELYDVVSTKREQIGVSYPEVDRQMLWAAMVLGDNEAHKNFMKKVRGQDGPAFDAAYNYRYYRGNRALMEERYERRPQEDLRTDRLVIDTLRVTWQTLRPLLGTRSSVLRDFSPSWWPID